MIIYKDFMNISRIAETKVNGVTKQDYVLLHENIPCHLSIKSVNSVDVQGNIIGTSTNFTIFCRNDVDILEGDKVEIDDYTFISSMPKHFKMLKKFEVGVSEWKE